MTFTRLDSIGVIKEVAEGHIEITRMGYGEEYFENHFPTDEEIRNIANEIGEKELWPTLGDKQDLFLVQSGCVI